MDDVTWSIELEVLLRVAAGMFLGGVVGAEREFARQPAGLRTHMLIAGAAALIVGLGQLIAADFSDEEYRQLVRIDPVRLIEAVVSAVGFVGAGTILKRREGEDVQGLTTAASILTCAGIGIACGLNHFVLAAGAAVLCLIVLRVLGFAEHRVLAKQSDAKKPDARKLDARKPDANQSDAKQSDAKKRDA